MAVRKEWLDELPPIPDSPEWRTDERRGYLARARESLSDDLARSLYWTLRIGEEDEQWAKYVEALPGYQWAQVGFLSPNEDSPLSSWPEVNGAVRVDSAKGSVCTASEKGHDPI